MARQSRTRYEEINQNSEDNDDGNAGAEFDDAIVATGFGRFHYKVVLVGGLANASDAIELLCVSLLLPAAQCDLDMSSEDKGWLNAAVFIGMMLGGYVWGALGDVYGRRKVLIVSLLVNAFAGVISSFVQNFPAFLAMRFISGLGVGGSIPLVWAYTSEFLPAKHRGRALSVVAAFWMIGNVAVARLVKQLAAQVITSMPTHNLYLAVAGLAIIPLNFEWISGNFSFSSWRLFLILCAMPSLAVGIWLLWMPESPMFLLQQRQNSDSLAILQQMFAFNTGRLAKDYPIHSLRNLDFSVSQLSSTNRSSSVQQLCLAITNTIQSAGQQTIALFYRGTVRVTLLLLFINYAISFGYYGLWLWFPELFNRLEQYYADHPDDELAMCDVVEFTPSGNSTTDDVCDDPNGPVDTQALVNTLITSIAPLPANLWTIYHMDKLGRKFFLVLSMLMSGASVFAIYGVKSTGGNLALSCVFGAVSTMGYNALDCLGAELFPTQLRSTALAVTLLAARFGAICGNVVFGYLVDTNCVVPMLTVATILVVGGLASILLPNSTRTALQ
ncbi:Major facilitator superfamily [Trinorchestia longiramus]|nr:Major facilitator superfamily [Trinorchestia longiramus]